MTDHPDAAQTLAQNAGDLKRSLEQSGISLVRLDIGSTGQESLSNFTGGGDGGQSTTGGQTRSQSEVDAVDDESVPAPATATTSASGALVDVLA